jgi:hypothetical protein
MKTAMQEFIEKLSMKSGDSFYALAFYHDNDKIIKEALEKEKQQSINLIKQTCMFMGASIIDIEISKMEFEDIYNNYYNQNK